MTLTLSVRQPWPWAMFYAGKNVENRDWSTKVRGRILLHASKAASDEDLLEVFESIARSGRHEIALPLAVADLPRGGIVGEAEIADCVTESDSPWFFGPYGFVLRNAKPLPFRPCKGRLGFFEVDEKDLYRTESAR